MFNSSPIESWEGAGAFFTFFGGGALFWFWVAVICLIIPIWVALARGEAGAGPARLAGSSTHPPASPSP